MAQFDTNIKHIPSISNSAADALFWYPFAQQEIEANAMIIIDIDKAIYNTVWKFYCDNNLFSLVIQNSNQYPVYTVKDELIYYQNQLCIPSNNWETHKTLLKAYYND